MQRFPAASSSEISELARCCAVFVPGDPARRGTVAFWRPDGTTPPPVAAGSAGDLTAALPGAEGVMVVDVPAVLLPVRAALPVLARARSDAGGHRGTVFWGAAAVLALQLVARGLLLPGLSPRDHDSWRIGPLSPRDVDRIRALAAAMPPEAHATPVPGIEPPRLPDPEQLLRALLSVLEEEWAVAGETLARARAALETAWDGEERPILRSDANRWTAVGSAAQLRLGRDGRWWPYREERGRWTPAGPAAKDPATAWAVLESASGDESP